MASADQKILSYQSNRSIRYSFSQLAELKRQYDLSLQTKNAKPFLDLYTTLGKDNSPVTYLDASRLKNLLETSNSRTIGINFLDLFCPLESRFISQAVEYPINYAIGDEINISQKVGPTLRLPITKSSQIIDAVHKQLDKNNVTSIQYFSGFLSNANVSARTGEYHASTVVGREQLNGVCHIIVRNSSKALRWCDVFEVKLTGV